MSEKSFEYHKAEIPQAWAHYRHIEETRTKYLSFFAAVVLAATGFLVTLFLKEPSPDKEALLASAAVVIFVIFAFSFVVWANMVRMGTVLHQYEFILEKTRESVHGTDSPVARLWLVRPRIPPEVKTGVFPPQAGGEYLVLGTCWFFLFAQGFLASYALCTYGPLLHLALKFTILAFVLLMLGLLIHGHARHRKIKAHEKSTSLVVTEPLRFGE